MQEKNYDSTCHHGRRIVHSILARRSVYSMRLGIRHDIGFATGRGRRYDSGGW